MRSARGRLMPQQANLENEQPQSFEIDERALVQAIQNAWLPVGKKLRDEIARVYNFKKHEIDVSGAAVFTATFDDTTYNALMSEQWDTVETKIEKHLTRAYERQFSERRAYTEKAEDDKKAGVIKALLGSIKTSFLTYAEQVAIPQTKKILDTLWKLDGVEQQAGTVGRNSRRVIQDSIRNMGNKVINFGVLATARNASIHSINQVNRSRKLKAIFEDSLAGMYKGQDNKLYLTAQLSAARSYNFAFLDWARKNNVTEYRIVPFLDRKTCVACLKMIDKVFHVADAENYRQRFIQAASDTDRLREEFPFLTPKAVSNPEDLVEKDEGTFYFPPFHPNCRCICVTDYESRLMSEPFGGPLSEIKELGWLTPDNLFDDVLSPKFRGKLEGETVLDSYEKDFNITMVRYRKAFDNAKEALEYYAKTYPGLALNIDDMPDDMKLVLLDTLENLRLYYPNSVAMLESISYSDVSDRPEVANSWAFVDQVLNSYKKTLTINKDTVQSLEAHEKDILPSIKNKDIVSTKLNTFVTTITHEVGHLVHDYLHYEQIYLTDNVLLDGLKRVRATAATLQERHAKEYVEDGELKKDFRIELSKYALTKPEELFAEYFTVKTFGAEEAQYNLLTEIIDDYINFLRTLPKDIPFKSWDEEYSPEVFTRLKETKAQIKTKQGELVKAYKKEYEEYYENEPL
jgi:hypothetical protein